MNYTAVLFLNDESGYGIEVKHAAERSVGKFVRIFRWMEPWEGGEMKVAVRIEPVEQDLDLRSMNMDDELEDTPSRPARRESARKTTAEPSRRQDPEPEAQEEESGDGLDDFFSELEDESSEDVPTFTDFKEMMKAANDKGHTTKEVMAAVRSLAYSRDSINEPAVINHIYREVTGSN